MKRALLILIPVVGLGWLISWRLRAKGVEAAQQTQMREARKNAAPVVSVAPVVVRDIVHTFESVGSVEAPFNVKLASKVTGRIDYLVAREGDRVKLGDVLVRIDPTEVEANVRQAQAAIAEARQRLAQAQITQNPTNVAVSTGIRQQQAAVDSARADFKQVSENYKSQIASAQAAVTDAQGKVESANAAVANAQSAINSAQANLDNANSKLKRTQDLYSQGFIAAQDVDDAKTAMSVQQANLEVARGLLRSARAQHDSAAAQKDSAERQLDIVKTKGLADIEASRAKVKQAEAALDYAKANRAQTPAFQAQIAALKAGVASAEANLRAAEARRADTVIVAPLNGFVTGRFMDPGAMATPGGPILAVQSMQTVWATVPVPEEESRKIVVGEAATARFDALPGRTFTGRVVQLNPSADPASRQFQMRVGLDNSQNLIRPGMYATVDIVIERVTGATVVPREAVVESKAGPTVTVVDDQNVAHVHPVKTGASDPVGIAVLSGIEPGEKVITMSAVPVKDGKTVKVGGQKKEAAR